MSKRIISIESEKTDLRNQIESLKLNHDELLRKHNDLFTETSRRVRLEDHLNQTGDLKRFISLIFIVSQHSFKNFLIIENSKRPVFCIGMNLK